MTKVYIEQQNPPDIPYSLVFWPNFRFEISEKRLFLRDVMEQYQEPLFTIVPNPDDADFFAVPYEYFFAEDEARSYLNAFFAKAKAAGKKVLLFDYTDYVERRPKVPEYAVLFRVSAYRHHKKKNEIVMPYFVEDIGRNYKVTPLEKTANPTVGYCGFSQFTSRAKKWRAEARWAARSIWLCAHFDKDTMAHKLGIFLRRSALCALREGGITVDSIERSFYSLHSSTVLLNPDTIRKEYIENLRRNNFALSVRGDSNASQRFYEILAASRIPVLIDTDCVLPLEELIDYDSCLVRINANNISEAATRVRKWHETHIPGSFFEAEQRSRRIYENYLCLDRFFAHVFDREKSPYRNLLYDIR